MNRRTATRTIIVTLGLLTLAACVVNLSFDMKKTVQVQTNAGATNYSQNVLVQLSDYKEITDHQKDISEFEKEASTGKDPELKQFASRTLPTLKEHLKLAHEMSRETTSASMQ